MKFQIIFLLCVLASACSQSPPPGEGNKLPSIFLKVLEIFFLFLVLWDTKCKVTDASAWFAQIIMPLQDINECRDWCLSQNNETFIARLSKSQWWCRCYLSGWSKEDKYYQDCWLNMDSAFIQI